MTFSFLEFVDLNFPITLISPLEGLISPIIIFSNVVFPEPFFPVSKKTSPPCKVSVTPDKTGEPPFLYDLYILYIESIIILNQFLKKYTSYIYLMSIIYFNIYILFFNLIFFEA